MNYELSLCPKIIFKNNGIEEVGKYVGLFGKNILFIYGSNSLKNSGKYAVIINSLKNNNIKYNEINGISSEPTPDIIDDITYKTKTMDINVILAVGGGSVIDTAKAVAALAKNESGIEDYLEGVGSGKVIVKNPLPVIAVPTTAGSGAEVTKNSVITNHIKKYKKSFRDEQNIPKLVLADPVLTLSLSKKQTAAGGMDALCQLIESNITKKKNPYCSALSSHFIPKAYFALLNLVNSPEKIDLRSDMLQASIASGLCLANSGLGIVHGFASGIGGMFKIPHGLICAILMPHSIKLNLEKNNELYNHIANIINGNNKNDSDELIKKLYRLNSLYDIPENFKEFNIDKSYAKEITVRSKGSSMNGNPVKYSENELEEFIKRLL